MFIYLYINYFGSVGYERKKIKIDKLLEVFRKKMIFLRKIFNNFIFAYIVKYLAEYFGNMSDNLME